jgi:hypothetical protein
MNLDNIPEISIKTYKFKLFDKEVFLLLQDNQVESFEFLFSLLNQQINYDEAIKLFIEDYVEKNIPQPSSYINNYTPDFILNNIIGNKESFQKIEEYYRIALRDKKISDITKG